MTTAIVSPTGQAGSHEVAKSWRQVSRLARCN
jgi:hypothetical protein